MIKWKGDPYSENTWEKRRQLDEEVLCTACTHAHKPLQHTHARTRQCTRHTYAAIPLSPPLPSPTLPSPLPQAIEEFEWKRYLPFTISDLIELPPHADVGLLAEEGYYGAAL